MTDSQIRLISVDDHIVEPLGTWQDRVPARYKELAPHVVEAPDGRQKWRYEDMEFPLSEPGAVRARDGIRQDYGLEDYFYTVGSPRFDEIRPGCYEPHARIADMDLDGVWAQLAFPSFARGAGHRFLEGKDRELSSLCSRAYNDFVLEEWCAVNPDRLLGMAILPLWNLEECVAEVERTAGRGVKAIAFPENPPALGLPSVNSEYWDPLWAAIQDVDLPVCMHIGSGGVLTKSNDEMISPAVFAMDAVGAMLNCTDWIYSGVFDRFPRLRIVLSEGGAGWVPYALERMTKVYGLQSSRIPSKRPPREVFDEHVFVCVVTDNFALANIEHIGVDNVLWESDYPHKDSMFPNSRTVFLDSTANLADGIARRFGELNARKVFGLAA